MKYEKKNYANKQRTLNYRKRNNKRMKRIRNGNHCNCNSYMSDFMIALCYTKSKMHTEK